MSFVTNQEAHVLSPADPMSATSEVENRMSLSLTLPRGEVDTLLKSDEAAVRLEEPDTPVAESKMLVAPEELGMPQVVLEQEQQRQLAAEMLEQQHEVNTQQPQLTVSDAKSVVIHNQLTHNVQPAQQYQQLQVQHTNADIKPAVLAQQQPVQKYHHLQQHFQHHHQQLNQVQQTPGEIAPLVLQSPIKQQQPPADSTTSFVARPALYPSKDQTIKKFAASNLDAPVQVQLHTASSLQSGQSSRVPIVLSINNWNGMPQEERLGFIEQLSERINKTMGLQVWLEKFYLVENFERGNRI